MISMDTKQEIEREKSLINIERRIDNNVFNALDIIH